MTTILLYLFLKGVAMWKIIILCIIKQIKRPGACFRKEVK